MKEKCNGKEEEWKEIMKRDEKQEWRGRKKKER